jgi:hypothetical protein
VAIVRLPDRIALGYERLLGRIGASNGLMQS